MGEILDIFGRPLKQVIRNSKGEPIILNRTEQVLADLLQKEWDEKLKNALGYEVSITTLTAISKRVSMQKYYQIPIAEYLPLRVGEGAFSTNIITYRSFDMSDQFETGIMNTGANNSRQATADAAVDAVPVVVRNWAKTIGYSVFDIEFAARSGNWDLITAKQKARKRNWDLGLQRIAFLGARGDASCLGLLTQGAGITNNTSFITAPISNLSVSNLKTFCAGIVEKYRANCNRTAMPSAFIMPESDYNGLAAPASSDFPIRSTLSLLQETFEVITQNKAFKILPLAYGDAAYNSAELNKQRYVLMNQDEESIRMDVPVDYTATLANSLDNFNFQNVGYGQFTGVVAYRPLETMYFSY